MYQYRQIIIRLRLGETERAIARAGLAGSNKIKAIHQVALAEGWLDTTKPEVLAPFFAQPKSKTLASRAKPYEGQIIQWLNHGIQATTIHATLVRQYGYQGSYFSVLRFVNKLKTKLTPVTMLLEFTPGECAQIDFGAGPKFVDTRTGEIVSSWIFVMVLAWSRLYAEIVWDKTICTWLKCHRHAFEFFGGVPSKLVIDNPKCAITKARYNDPQVQRAYADLAEGYGFIISPCPPRHPQKKGRVEAGVKYIKNNFLPPREFCDIVEANQQLIQWTLEVAGNRIHGSTHEKPLTRFKQVECLLLKALPVQPPELAS